VRVKARQSKEECNEDRGLDVAQKWFPRTGRPRFRQHYVCLRNSCWSTHRGRCIL